MKPPGVKECWDDCGADTQAMILGFDQIRDYDESQIPKLF